MYPINFIKVVIFLVPLLISSCTSKKLEQIDINHPSSCSAMQVDKIYFGTKTPNGIVSKEDWEHFISEIITPYFPKGVTVTLANGQWMGENENITKEISYILEIVHENKLEDELAIKKIVSYYKDKYDQDSVLVLSSSARACY
jgi:hypothetical protein